MDTDHSSTVFTNKHGAPRWLTPVLLSGLLLLGGCPWDRDPKPGSGGGSPPTTYTVSGTVSGLNGSVTMANNGGDARTLTSNGAFTFSTALASGAAYNVTVTSQPSTQTCTVGNGSGSIASSNVTNVTVTCVTATYTIGGTVTGLTGSGLVLQNNGADNLARAVDGAFTFATAINSGSAYNVSVLTQPTNPAQTCTPTNNAGNVTANVTNVTITCATNSTVGSASIGPAGGTVNGLYGATITVPAGALANTVTIGLSRDSSNSPAFAVPSIDAVGATYEVTPHGQSFSAPVTVRIPFDSTLVPNDVTPVLYKAEIGGAFAAIPTTVNGNFLEATVTSFSWFIPGATANKPRMVYAIQRNNGTTPHLLASYKINPTTGALAAASSLRDVGELPVAVIAHPSRRWVYVTHGGSTNVNGIAANSIARYRLNTTNGQVINEQPATTQTSHAPGAGYPPDRPAIHPSGKFLYVMNFGNVGFGGGGDINLFAINSTNGVLTRSSNVIDSGGAQPMGMVFNRLGTRAYVLFAGSASANTFSTQVKVYDVNMTTGELTGPTSGVAAGVLGSNPWSIAIDPNEKFVYVVTLSTDEIIGYSINSSTGALTNIGSATVTGQSRLASLAVDSFARFLFAGRQQPWLSRNLLPYQYNASSGALTPGTGVLTPCGGGCVGGIYVVGDPQAQFLYTVDSEGKLGGFAVNQSTGALTAVNSIAGILTTQFAVTGTSPVFQSNCTAGCATTGIVTTTGGGSTTNPSPPTTHNLSVGVGAFFGYVTSSPGGINYGPPTNGNPTGLNDFSANFPANSSVQLCSSPPPQPAGPYDITWGGSCSGTGTCTSVTMDGDKNCFADFQRRLP